ncbi:MAG: hypothetical protein V4717_12660 [Bacteroidota bacterium]
MKQTFFKLRTASFILALSGLMITLAVPSFANNKKNTSAVANESIQPVVKYLGFDESGANFLVTIDAAAAVTFELTIRNKSGMMLFNKVYETANFSKTFKVLNEEQENMELAFTVKSLPDGATSTFTVSTEEKTVTEIAVTKTK